MSKQALMPHPVRRTFARQAKLADGGWSHSVAIVVEFLNLVGLPLAERSAAAERATSHPKSRGQQEAARRASAGLRGGGARVAREFIAHLVATATDPAQRADRSWSFAGALKWAGVKGNSGRPVSRPAASNAFQQLEQALPGLVTITADRRGPRVRVCLQSFLEFACAETVAVLEQRDRMTVELLESALPRWAKRQAYTPQSPTSDGPGDHSYTAESAQSEPVAGETFSEPVIDARASGGGVVDKGTVSLGGARTIEDDRCSAGRKGGSPPGASAALAGETAGLALASSAGARKAQPSGGQEPAHEPLLGLSAWMRPAPVLGAMLCKLARDSQDPTLPARVSGLVLGFGTAREVALQVMQRQTTLDAEASEDGIVGSVSRASLRLVGADVARMLSTGSLIRGEDGAVRVPIIATNPVLALLDLRVEPDGARPSPAMLACLTRWFPGDEDAVVALGKGEAQRLQEVVRWRSRARVIVPVVRTMLCMVERHDPSTGEVSADLWSRHKDGEAEIRPALAWAPDLIAAMGPRWAEFKALCQCGPLEVGHPFEQELAELRAVEKRGLAGYLRRKADAHSGAPADTAAEQVDEPPVADLADEQEAEPGPDADEVDEAAALWADADLVEDLARAEAPAANDHDAQLDEPPLARVAGPEVDAVLEQHFKRATADQPPRRRSIW